MPRGKKTSESVSKKSKKHEEVDEVDVDVDEVELVSKKTSKKSSKDKSSKKKPIEVEDDLSELDIDDDDDIPAHESAENDTVVQTVQKEREKPVRKTIDPKTPIGELSIQDGLNYYIQLGDQTCNPSLKYGALNLLKDLTGRRRPGQNYGSKSNRNGNGGPQFNQRGGSQNRGRGGSQNRGRTFNPRSTPQQRESVAELYDEQE